MIWKVKIALPDIAKTTYDIQYIIIYVSKIPKLGCHILQDELFMVCGNVGSLAVNCYGTWKLAMVCWPTYFIDWQQSGCPWHQCSVQVSNSFDMHLYSLNAHNLVQYCLLAFQPSNQPTNGMWLIVEWLYHGLTTPNCKSVFKILHWALAG